MPEKKPPPRSLWMWTWDDQMYPDSGVLTLVTDPSELERCLREYPLDVILEDIERGLKKRLALPDPRGETAQSALDALNAVKKLLISQAVDPRKFTAVLFRFLLNAVHAELGEPIIMGIRGKVGQRKGGRRGADHGGYEAIILTMIDEKGLPFSGEWLWDTLVSRHPKKKPFQRKGYTVWFAGGDKADGEDARAFQTRVGEPRTLVNISKRTFRQIFERIRKKLADK